MRGALLLAVAHVGARFGTRQGVAEPMVDSAAAAGRGAGCFNGLCGPDAAFMRKWNFYRLGDFVKGAGVANLCDTDWQGTIGCLYARRTRKKNSGSRRFSSDIGLLLDIVRGRRQADLPSPKSIVMHMRVGDGVEGPDCWNKISDCWYPNGILYAIPREVYEHVAPLLPRAQHGYHIEMLGVAGHNARHPPSDTRDEEVATEYQRSKTYLRSAIKYFEGLGYRVHLRQVHDPDTDFTFMASAHTFVQGGGGYSGLVAQLVERGGTGRVLRSPKVKTCGANKQLCYAYGRECCPDWAR